MDLLDILWNIRQQQQIGGVTAKTAVAAAEARAQEATLADLSSPFERLALVTQALAELLFEHTPVTEADLLAKITAIDMRHGPRQGLTAVARRSCPSCGHEVAGHRTVCLYCGASLGPAKPFDGI